MASDKPKNVISVSDLDDIEDNPHPVRVPLKGGKFVTFPDVLDMPLEETERFFMQINRALETNIMSPALKEWLSKDDYEALIGQYPTYRKLKPVIERVMSKYEAQWGDEGNGSASTA